MVRELTQPHWHENLSWVWKFYSPFIFEIKNQSDVMQHQLFPAAAKLAMFLSGWCLLQFIPCSSKNQCFQVCLSSSKDRKKFSFHWNFIYRWNFLKGTLNETSFQFNLFPSISLYIMSVSSVASSLVEMECS